MRIAHVLAPARYGGLESVVATLADGQRGAGHDVTVVGIFAESPDGHPFWQGMERRAGIRTIPVVVPARGYLAERRAVRGVLTETRAQILHTHGYRPDVLAAPEARRAGAATVTTVHGFSGGSLKNRTYEWVQRRALRAFDGVVAVSSRLAGELIAAGVPERRVRCIPNAWSPGVEPMSKRAARDRLGLPDEGQVIGWVGRFSAAKAPDMMVDAFARLDDPDVVLSMVGDGPLRPALEQSVSGTATGGRVRWHGMVPDAGSILPAFDVLAITSRTEGTPMVLLEAMAAGVPVVTTAVGGIPDVVSGAEALLVETDDAASIARAVGSILAGDPSTAERALAARARLEWDFSVEPWVRRYDDVYRSCLVR